MKRWYATRTWSLYYNFHHNMWARSHTHILALKHYIQMQLHAGLHSFCEIIIHNTQLCLCTFKKHLFLLNIPSYLTGCSLASSKFLNEYLSHSQFYYYYENMNEHWFCFGSPIIYSNSFVKSRYRFTDSNIRGHFCGMNVVIL